LTGLQTLNLTGCEGLEELPAGMGALTGLHKLSLSARLRRWLSTAGCDSGEHILLSDNSQKVVQHLADRQRQNKVTLLTCAPPPLR